MEFTNFYNIVYENAKKEHNGPVSVSRDITKEIKWFFDFWKITEDFTIEQAIEEAVEMVIDESTWDNITND